VQFADARAAPCTAGGGDDSELFWPDGRPRGAAAVLLGGLEAGPLSGFGPAPSG
jgi:hypothetical protein